MDRECIVFCVQFNHVLRNCTRMRGDIPAWNELIDKVHQFTFDSYPEPIVVTVDWKNTKEFIDESVFYSFDSDEIKPQEDFDAMIQRFNEYRRLKSIGLIKSSLEIELSVCNSSDESSNFGYVINVLHQIFLVMNLSVPGSCDFYSATVYPMERSNKNTLSKEVRLSLSGSILEGIAELSKQLKWVEILDIPVETTLSWIQRIGFSESHFARSNTERAIFGMLHSCSQDDINPTTLIWLAQALEALFDTPEAGISSLLRERAFLVLGEPNENRNKIRKAINSFYDYRSRYVHGEISIPNPMSMWLSDESLDKFQDELLRHIDLAMLLLVASLQKLIVGDGDEFKFSEAVSVRSQIKEGSNL